MFELLGRYKIGLPSQGKDPENEPMGKLGRGLDSQCTGAKTNDVLRNSCSKKLVGRI